MCDPRSRYKSLHGPDMLLNVAPATRCLVRISRLVRLSRKVRILLDLKEPYFGADIDVFYQECV